MKRSLSALLLLISGAAGAHPLAPMLLQLTAEGGGVHQVEWRVSAIQPDAQQPLPVLPAHCEQLRPAEISRGEGGALIARWPVQCAKANLGGETIAVSGLRAGGGNAVVRVVDSDQATRQGLLDAAQPGFEVPPRSGSGALFLRHTAAGAGHLLGGADHLLFLLGLLLVVSGWRRLLIAVTAFTVGHSLTLALAVLGLVPVNGALMELGIAFSLVVVARAALVRTRALPVASAGVLAAGFGLLHGLGFAGALSELGLPASELPLALLGFNIGIELAQLAVIAVLLAVARLAGRAAAQPLRLGSAYAVGGLGMMWVIDRAAQLAI